MLRRKYDATREDIERSQSNAHADA